MELPTKTWGELLPAVVFAAFAGVLCYAGWNGAALMSVVAAILFLFGEQLAG